MEVVKGQRQTAEPEIGEVTLKQCGWHMQQHTKCLRVNNILQKKIDI